MKILAFGEILLRLSAAQGLSDNVKITAYYGGTESNVLLTLSSFGERTEFISCLPDNPLGQGALEHLHHYGIGTTYVFLAASSERLGVYYSANQPGDRTRKVTYDRKESAITKIDFSRLDFDALFKDAAIFHVSGISLALSQSCADAALLLAKEARRRGIPVSFDVNYREALWGVAEAKTAFQKIIEDVDFLFGGVYDLTTFFDCAEANPYPDFFTHYGAKAVFGTSRGPNLSLLIGTMGAEVHWRSSKGLQEHKIPLQRFKIIDRIGSGDAFDAGVLEVLLHRPEAYKDALAMGLACAILKHKVKGDVLFVSKKEAESLKANLSW